jgi:uncharacterized protein
MTESNPPPPSPLPYAGPGYMGPEPDKDAKMWGMLCHLSALIQFLGIPSIVGPLVIWLIKKNEMPFVDDQGKEAVNFHITVIIAAIVLSPTICLGIGVFVLVGLGIVSLIFSVVGAIKASSGIVYRYPVCIRFIK